MKQFHTLGGWGEGRGAGRDGGWSRGDGERKQGGGGSRLEQQRGNDSIDPYA